MSMSKQDFVALADVIKQNKHLFSSEAIGVLVGLCRTQNSAFKKDRWIDYIAGKCGPNGGAIKHQKG